MFSPLGMNEKDETYYIRTLMLQSAYFGPFPDKFVEFSDDLTKADLDEFEELVAHRGGRRKYRNTLAAQLSKETVAFLDKIMKLDPRDRPAPQEFLRDQWLAGVSA